MTTPKPKPPVVKPVEKTERKSSASKPLLDHPGLNALKTQLASNLK